MGRVDPLELGMGLVVGHGEDGAIAFLEQPGEIAHVGRNSVGQQDELAARLEPAGGFIAIADRTTAIPSPRSRSNASLSAGGTRSTSTIKRRGARGGEATRLIFDQRPPGERKQGAKPPASSS